MGWAGRSSKENKIFRVLRKTSVGLSKETMPPQASSPTKVTWHIVPPRATVARPQVQVSVGPYLQGTQSVYSSAMVLRVVVVVIVLVVDIDVVVAGVGIVVVVVVVVIVLVVALVGVAALIYSYCYYKHPLPHENTDCLVILHFYSHTCTAPTI